MLRRSPRALALWIAALAVAVVTAAVVAGSLATLHRRTTSLGPLRSVVVAVHDLAIGDAIGPSDVRVRSVHRSQLPPGTITRPRTVSERVVSSPVLRGGFVTHRNLTPPGSLGIAGAIPAGMRAMRVVVTDALRPPRGAAVDLLATLDPGASTPGSGDPSGGGTVVVAAGVLVVSTDARGGGNGRADVRGITVLVSPAEAQRLALAQSVGVVTVTLVPPQDTTRPASREGSR